MQDGPEGEPVSNADGPERKVVACWGLIINMQDGEKLSREQIQAFLEASEEVRFEGQQRTDVYAWITRLLRQQGYREQGKKMRGLLRRYISKMTGLSRTQVTRPAATPSSPTNTPTENTQKGAW